MTEDTRKKFNTLALLGAVIAAIGLIMIVVADRMYEGAENEYLTTDMTYEEYIDQLGVIDAIWTVGTVLIAAAVILVAVSVPATSASSFEAMKRKLESDFYRKCPSCGAWNTKLAASCTTCGILLPKLQESSPIEPGPRMMREGP